MRSFNFCRSARKSILLSLGVSEGAAPSPEMTQDTAGQTKHQYHINSFLDSHNLRAAAAAAARTPYTLHSGLISDNVRLVGGEAVAEVTW